ncbi:MAG: glycosyltransferase family 4 protein, partial [Candidatus Saccharimonadales bacterium]
MDRHKTSASRREILKIGLVLDTSLDPPDGVQQYVISIGEWLRSQGHDVHYLVGQTDKRQLPNIHSLARNVSVIFNGNRTTIPLPASRRKLRRFIEQENFDVLHVQTPHHPLLAQRLILAASPRTAVIGTFHILPYGWTTRIGNRLLGLWLRPSLKRFDRMLAVSPVAAEFCQRSFGLPAEVLPNVVDYHQYHAAKPLPQYADDKLTILFLGRLVPRKGCLTLLQAVAKLLHSGQAVPPFRVVICGRGQLERKLRQFVADNTMKKIVEFTGFVSDKDKPRYYASADIAVFPSSGGESFGIVLLEAMASGKAAVLAGDNPGYHSVMKPYPEALFDPRDSDALAEKLPHYLTNPTDRSRAAAWGAAYSRDFDTAVVGQKLLAIYQEA